MLEHIVGNSGTLGKADLKALRADLSHQPRPYQVGDLLDACRGALEGMTTATDETRAKTPERPDPAVDLRTEQERLRQKAEDAARIKRTSLEHELEARQGQLGTLEWKLARLERREAEDTVATRRSDYADASREDLVEELEDALNQLAVAQKRVETLEQEKADDLRVARLEAENQQLREDLASAEAENHTLRGKMSELEARLVRDGRIA